MCHLMFWICIIIDTIEIMDFANNIDFIGTYIESFKNID